MDARIRRSEARVYTIPTEAPESDGTLEWKSTTLVLVRLDAGKEEGIGYTYGSAALGPLLRKKLLPLLEGADPYAPAKASAQLFHEARNLGAEGAVAMAISAVDIAAWDLKAKLLGLPLASLLGSIRHPVPAYWSAGFTSYSVEELQEEFRSERARGFRHFKMKVGRAAEEDPGRVAAARAAIGPDRELYVDANGAYSVSQALGLAQVFAKERVTWFEEPVRADDLEGLARVRAALPPGMALATGEYGSSPRDFDLLLSHRAADVLQADATRCGGVTGFLAAASLASARNIPFSSHTAPSIHAHLDAAAPDPFLQLEYFRDHVRVESMLFRGSPRVEEGALVLDPHRPGLGLELREDEAEAFAEAT